MKTQKTIFLILAIFIFGCGKNNNPPCDTISSEFQTIFQNMIANGHTEEVTYDTEIHEYTFTLSANREVCMIGYQSQPAISSTAYKIEIIDNSTSTIIYSDNHIFSSTKTSYVTLTSTTILLLGTSYTIRRTILLSNANRQFGNIIGRIASKRPMNFPYSNGIMTITNANFYQNGGPLADFGVPYIDLIFR
jgi:hypothetical protein